MDLKALREEFASLHSDADKVLTLAAGEKRELTADEQKANAGRFPPAPSCSLRSSATRCRA